MNIVELNSVSKSFDNHKVVDNFSFGFEQGKNYAIMGKSGIGKTTLLNIILGLVKEDGGEITRNTPKISATFQEDRLCEYFNALDNLKAVMTAKNAPKIAERILTELGLGGNLKSPVNTFSGGMKRRVAIARALVADSDLIVMDEPFKGLDGETKIMTAKVILEYTKDKTIIFTTHQEEDICFLDATLLRL